jgi:Flp pilus assembly protein TadG
MRLASGFRGVPRPGGVTVWVVLGLSVIVGLLAIGMDGGRMMEERRHVQLAADAAALAAAADLYANYSQNQGLDPKLTAKAAAQTAAAANGYSNDGVNSVVTVNVPPQSGTFKGKAAYAEVIVRSNLQGTFGAIFSGSSLPVQARAVGLGRSKKYGMILLQATGPDAFLDKTNGAVTVAGPIIVNSTDLTAYDQLGSGAVTADSFQIAGNYKDSGGLMVGPINTGVSPTPDPLASIPQPTLSNYTLRSSTALSLTSGTTILQPGIYQGGVQIGGTANVTLTSGIYIMDGGGFQFTGTGSVTGSGVMIYNTSVNAPAGPISFGAGVGILSPPTSGTYQGISFFQDRSLTQPLTMTGNGVNQITGVVYAPGCTVILTENGSALTLLVSGPIVASAMQLKSKVAVTVKQTSGLAPFGEVHLAE